MSSVIKPFISADRNIAEITIKGSILSILLAMLLAAANTYLGLKIGITITGSIPAAIISMALLKLFKTSTILENNIVQTGASAGDTLAAGAIFTLPAIVIVNYWFGFDFWSCFTITLLGGILGVLFSIPLRRAFINDETLKFPEGVAIGNVLIASADTGENVKKMLAGSIIGAIISFSQNGLKILADSAWALFNVGGSVIGIGTGFDIAILGAGYIVGINVGISILVGSIIAWLVLLPIFSHYNPLPFVPNYEFALTIWSNHIRYVGVGTMSIGGIWALFTLFKPVVNGIHSSMMAFKEQKSEDAVTILRTEKDIPFNYVLWGTLIILILSSIVIYNAIADTGLPLDTFSKYLVLLVGAISLLVLGLILSAICCYLAGLVGSSSNPMSGLLITGILVIALALLGILGSTISFNNPENVKKAVGLTVVIIAMIGSSIAIAQDNMQDLKAGQLVGATPWKQQIMLIVGVVSAALVLPPTLDLLYNAYGIGGAFPRIGMDPDQMLAAPQATLVAAVAKGVYGLSLPWTEIAIGVLIGMLTIIIDHFLRKKNMRLPVLAVGIGIYLPSTAAVTLVVGSILSFIVNNGLNRKTKDKQKIEQAQQIGISIASGFVCGGSIMGILLAIPAVIYQSTDTMRIIGSNWQSATEALITITVLIVFTWFYRTVIKHVK